jgi:hypothetical protein
MISVLPSRNAASAESTADLLTHSAIIIEPKRLDAGLLGCILLAETDDAKPPSRLKVPGA